MDKRMGKPKQGCDTNKLQELHSQGLCDTQIARAMGLYPKTVRRYRKELGLEPNAFDPNSDNGTKGWDMVLARKLYDEGCSDTVIAAKLGIGITVVFEWRTALELPANYALVFDEERAKALYDKGMNDTGIAKELDVSRTAVSNWRKKEGLEPNLVRRKLDHVKAKELYDKGWNDVQIGKELNASPNAVTNWRRRHGLPANHRYDPDRARELYDSGLSDGKIGKELGVDKSTIRAWRIRTGLPTKQG